MPSYFCDSQTLSVIITPSKRFKQQKLFINILQKILLT